MTEPNNNKTTRDPETTVQDRICLAFCRAALFPLQVDWSGKHYSIHPALTALDGIRRDLTESGLPFSSLFPRRVAMVPSRSSSSSSSSSSTNTMQWSGQPDLDEENATMEVIPNILQVKSMECSGRRDGPTAFVRMVASAATTTSGAAAREAMRELVVCSNRGLLRPGDVRGGTDLLDQRKDLPVTSLRAVEEALAHQLVRVRMEQQVCDRSCETVARMHVEAARVAECLYQRQGSEVRRGGALQPPGMSWLPSTLRQTLQNRCVQDVATRSTTHDGFDAASAKKSVMAAMTKK